MSVTDLSHLLSVTVGQTFPVRVCRKIMGEVDVDQDTFLSPLDLLAVLYLTDAYLAGMAGRSYPPCAMITHLHASHQTRPLFSQY